MGRAGVHRADATRQVPADRRRDAARKHGHHIGIRRRGAALPRPARPRRRTRHADVREIDQRGDAFAAALAGRCRRPAKVVGIMARNHRGFVEALIAANRIGADVLLLNTSFAGPALAEVVAREGVDAVIYDEEFTATVDRALADKPDATRIVAWTDGPQGGLTVEKMVGEYAGRQPQRDGAKARRKSKVILLTSGTTGSPRAPSTPAALTADRESSRRSLTAHRGARRSRSSSWHRCSMRGASRSSSSRRRWRAQSSPAASSTPRPHSSSSTGTAPPDSASCPVMFDRIMELPDEVRNKYSGRSLRFAAASGSRMRPDVVTKLHGSVRRRDLQQLQRHRGRHDRHRDSARPAGRARHRGQAGRWHRNPDSGPGFHRVADRRSRWHLRAQLHPVRRLHLRQDQGLSRGLHVVGRCRVLRRGRAAVRRRPRRRDDRVRR